MKIKSKVKSILPVFLGPIFCFPHKKIVSPNVLHPSVLKGIPM